MMVAVGETEYTNERTSQSSKSILQNNLSFM